MKHEIHFEKKSISFSVFECQGLDISSTAEAIKKSTPFQPAKDIADTDPGVIAEQFEHDETFIRGTFAMVVAFEVEEFDKAPELKYRVDTCEFLISQDVLLLWGDSSARKQAEITLGILSQYNFEKLEPSQYALRAFHDALETVSRVQLENDDGDVHRVRLDGRIEDYSHFNVVRAEHTLKSVSGSVVFNETSYYGVSANHKGTVKISNAFSSVHVPISDIFKIIEMVQPGTIVYGCDEKSEEEIEKGTDDESEKQNAPVSCDNCNNGETDPDDDDFMK